MRKAIFGIMVAIGVVMLIGSAGASDAGVYTFAQTVRYACSGIVLIYIGTNGMSAHRDK